MPDPEKKKPEPKKAQCPDCETEGVLGEDCVKCGLDMEGFLGFRRFFKLNSAIDERERSAEQKANEAKLAEDRKKALSKGRFWPHGGKD